MPGHFSGGFNDLAVSSRSLVYLIAILISTITSGAHASVGRYVGLIPSQTSAWGTADMVCQDGVTSPCCSSLVKSEMRTGVLRSKAFQCPAKLSFWFAGYSHQNKNFVRLVDAGTGQVYKSEPPPDQNAAQFHEWDLSSLAGKMVYLELTDGDTGSGWAWMTFGRLEPEVVPMPKSGDTLPSSDWTEVRTEPEPVVADGIPFMKGCVWLCNKEGDSMKLPMGGVQAQALYLLGGDNSVDSANPGWGGSNSFDCIFIGDKAGDITIRYKSGIADTVPFVFGYTTWWRNAYNCCPAPFHTDQDKRKLLDRALCIANGTDGGDKPYYLKISLRSEPVESIEFTDNAAKAGNPVVDGVTFEGVMNPSVKNEEFSSLSGSEMPAAARTWLDEHTIRSADPFPSARQKALGEIGRLLYTHPNDINSRTIADTRPEVTAENYAGPKVRFEGTPVAELLTNIYYENSQEILNRVDKAGMVHESGEKAPYFHSFGGWEPGRQAFYGDSYTRIRALTLLTNAGFDLPVERAINYFDHWMMYYPRSFPQVQLDGKPVPGHASVIANRPHVYFDEIRWGTKYKTHDFGNPETDGHGMLMLTRWRAWVKGGRTKTWVDKHWEAISEAAEYIPWCLDNPDLSFSEHGLLYAESEGGMRMESLYCNIPCYYGLLAYAEMADASGRPDKAERWRKYADRLLSAISAWFPTTASPWGDVWDPAKSAGWPGYHSVLSPVLFGADYWGYDAIHELPKDWAERTQRTYKMQLTKNQPEWCTPAGLGYGQCYITEGALLLDQMSDADKMIGWLARFCFAPKLPHPYRVPEGITMASDGSVWRRWGDLGNLYQLAETVYTTQIMIGIDDVHPDEVRLMPRLPIGWTGLEVNQWPVRTISNGRSVQAMLSMNLKRDRGCGTLDLSISTGKPVDHLRIRLGPFPTRFTEVEVSVNDGKKTRQALELIGDSKWAWIRLGDGTLNYEIHARAR